MSENIPSNKQPSNSTPLKTNIISVDDTNNSRNSHSAANASSQMQLLGLAKKFVLDGGFISNDLQPPIDERADRRERLSLLRKQQNLENIIKKSVAYCSKTEITDRADQDWFNKFLALAEDVSNRTMQDLWAKILAGEVSKPGSFSLKSLKAFQLMSINEAKLLAKACSLAVKDSSKNNIRIISGCYQTPSLFNFFNKNRERKISLNQFGLSYTELLTLADNNLLFIQQTETSPLNKKEELRFNYNGQGIQLTALKNQSIVNFYKFTPIGTELANLIGDNSSKEYLGTLKENLSQHFRVTIE